MPSRWLCFFLGGCTDGKTSGEDEEAAPASDYVLAEVDTTTCAAVPDARRRSQMASFFQDVPIEIDGVRTQRGFILFGGDDGVTPSLRDDLCLYDFANSPTLLCPWHKLADSADGSLPTSDAAFGFDPATGLFLLAGGRVQDGATLYASSQILTLDLNNLSAGFSSVGALPELDYTFTSTGDPRCATQDIDILSTEIDPDCACEVCVVVAECSRNPCTGEMDAPLTGSDPNNYCQSLPNDPIAACSGDPQCTDATANLAQELSDPGRWGSQAFMNPESGALWLIGGSTGCEGSTVWSRPTSSTWAT